MVRWKVRTAGAVANQLINTGITPLEITVSRDISDATSSGKLWLTIA